MHTSYFNQPNYFDFDDRLCALCIKKPAKNNSEIIRPPFNSKINRFNTYNTNLIVKSSGLTLVGHGRLLPIEIIVK